MNQSLFLKVENRRKELSVSPAIPIRAVTMGNQIVDEGKLIFIQLF